MYLQCTWRTVCFVDFFWQVLGMMPSHATQDTGILKIDHNCLVSTLIYRQSSIYPCHHLSVHVNVELSVIHLPLPPGMSMLSYQSSIYPCHHLSMHVSVVSTVVIRCTAHCLCIYTRTVNSTLVVKLGTVWWTYTQNSTVIIFIGGSYIWELKHINCRTYLAMSSWRWGCGIDITVLYLLAKSHEVQSQLLS